MGSHRPIRGEGAGRDRRRCADGALRLAGDHGAVPPGLRSRQRGYAGHDSRGSHPCPWPRASAALIVNPGVARPLPRLPAYATADATSVTAARPRNMAASLSRLSRCATDHGGAASSAVSLRRTAHPDATAGPKNADPVQRRPRLGSAAPGLRGTRQLITLGSVAITTMLVRKISPFQSPQVTMASRPGPLCDRIWPA
jgi:hypothetical protein